MRILDITTRRLFVDDEHISVRERLTRTMHTAEKHRDNPVLLPDRRWEGGMAVINNSIIYDTESELFRMWYWGNPGNGLESCVASSVDGLRWEKPPVGIREYEESHDNNLIGLMIHQIVYGGDAFGDLPADWMYRTMNWSAERGQWAAHSRDGLRWNDGGDVSFSAGDTFKAFKSTEAVTGSDRAPGYLRSDAVDRYMGFVRYCCPVGRFDGSSDIRPTRRVQVMIQSGDWIEWGEPVRILTPDERDDVIAEARIAEALEDGSLVHNHPDDHRAEFYTMYVWPYEDLYIGMLLLFYPSYEFHRDGLNNQSGPGEIQLIASRDLYEWRRLGDRQPFIAKGGPGEFDWAGAWYTNPPFVKDGKLLFFYTGVTITHGGSRDERYVKELQQRIDRGEIPATHSIGLATIRRDGFVSLDALNEPGRLITKPFGWPGGRLHLNADASRGWISAWVLQPDGTPVDAGLESNRICGDHLDYAVDFHAKQNTRAADRDVVHTHGTAEETGTARAAVATQGVSVEPGAPVRLELKAANASLFAYWFS